MKYPTVRARTNRFKNSFIPYSLSNLQRHLQTWLYVYLMSPITATAWCVVCSTGILSGFRWRVSPGQCVVVSLPGLPAPPNYVACCTGCLCVNTSKLALITFKARRTGCPVYTASLLNEYRPTRTLHSPDGLLFTIPFYRLSLGNRAVSINAPRVWNNLTHDCLAGSSIACFKRNLKTEQFNVAYPV